MSDAPKTIWIETRHIPDNVALDKWDVEPDQNEAAYFAQYTRSDTIPSQDALICAALEEVFDAIGAIPCEVGDTKHYWKCQDAIRALADNPDALAAIIAKAEGRV